jgi:hypothetical protein
MSKVNRDVARHTLSVWDRLALLEEDVVLLLSHQTTPKPPVIEVPPPGPDQKPPAVDIPSWIPK